MATFYGNFTDNSKPSFQFDKIYPNYKIMRALEKNDDIFVGRQILIEYNKNPKDFLLKCAKENNEFKNFCVNKGITFDEENYEYFTINYNDWNNKNWTDDESKENCYILNDYLDLYDDRQSNEDSTVWEKIYNSADGQSYIKIAELNAMIPTLRIVSTTPTTSMEAKIQGTTGAGCIQLNIPKNWNFRVKQVGISSLSDESGFDENNNEIPLDIFYNKAGLTGTEIVDGLTNKIEVTPRGEYQELSIHLPAIGNAVARVNAVKEAMGNSSDTGSTASNATWWAQFNKLSKDMQDRVNDDTLLTKDEAAEIYLTTANAANTYLTIDDAANTYLTTASAANTYLTTANAALNYVQKSNIKSIVIEEGFRKIEETTKTNDIKYYDKTNNENSWLIFKNGEPSLGQENEEGVLYLQHKQQYGLQERVEDSNSNLKYYGGATGEDFYVPQFTIDKAGHITSIGNHSNNIVGDNIWIENNKIESSTGHWVNTITHKTQPQLYYEAEQPENNINKVSIIPTTGAEPQSIIYGGKIAEDDEKIYIPSLTLDEAGHITDINNNSDLMDMLFYHEGEEVNDPAGDEYNPAYGWITSNLRTIYITIFLKKYFLPFHYLSFENLNTNNASGDISLLLRFSVTHNSTGVQDFQYLFTGDPASQTGTSERSLKSLFITPNYQFTGIEASQTRPKVKIKCWANICRITITLPSGDNNQTGPTFLPAYWGNSVTGYFGQLYPGTLNNNAPIVGECRIKNGKIIKDENSTSIIYD